MHIVNTFHNIISTIMSQTGLANASTLQLALILFAIIVFIILLVIATIILVKENNKINKQKSENLSSLAKIPEATVDVSTKELILEKEAMEFATEEIAGSNTDETYIPKILPLVKQKTEINMQDKEQLLEQERKMISGKAIRVPVSSNIPPPVPAATTDLHVGELIIDPPYARPGDTVIISCKVTNTGYTGGYHTISLQIGSEIIYEEKVFLVPGQPQEMSFPFCAVTLGDWDVNINGLCQRLIIAEEA